MRKVNAAKRLFILGTYGCGNRGDEAILESVVRYFQDADIWITNGKCDDMRKYLPVRTVRCRLAEGKITPSVFFSILFHSFHQLYRILCSDALIYGGGSSIHDLTPYNLVYMFFWQWVAQHFGKKVFYLGMGIGPIATERGKKLCRKFLSKADGLYARDDRGYQLCVDQGIRNVQRSCDLAFYQNGPEPQRADILTAAGFTSGSYITVSASQWFQSTNFWDRNRMDFSSEVENFARCLETLHGFYRMPLLFMPTFHYDMMLGQELEQKLGSDVLTCHLESASLTEMSEMIANAHLHFGVRMHSIIFALRRGTPVLPVIYDEKVRQLLMRFPGVGELAIDLKTLTPEALREKLIALESKRELRIVEITNVKDTLYQEAKASLDETAARINSYA